MDDIVKYHNDINKIQFTKFNANDLNILMKICVKLNQNENEKLEISFEELKESIGYIGHRKQFIKFLDDLTDKIGIIKIWNNEDFDKIFLFKRCKTTENNLLVELNEEYVYFFKEIQKQFTTFSLNDFVRIEGKHAKNIYRLIMQWKTKGHCPTEYETSYFSIAEIKGFLNIPDDYEIKYLKRDVLEPAIKELNELRLIKNLELVVHKAKKRGSPVLGYSFTFTPIGKRLSDEQKKAIEHKEKGTYQTKANKSKNKFKNFDERKYSDKYFYLLTKINSGIALTEEEKEEFQKEMKKVSKK